ncbi:hypothetical protein ACE6H2_001551 [Prunus campanulata]
MANPDLPQPKKLYQKQCKPLLPNLVGHTRMFGKLGQQPRLAHTKQISNWALAHESSTVKYRSILFILLRSVFLSCKFCLVQPLSRSK